MLANCFFANSCLFKILLSFKNILCRKVNITPRTYVNYNIYNVNCWMKECIFCTGMCPFISSFNWQRYGHIADDLLDTRSEWAVVQHLIFSLSACLWQAMYWNEGIFWEYSWATVCFRGFPTIETILMYLSGSHDKSCWTLKPALIKGKGITMTHSTFRKQHLKWCTVPRQILLAPWMTASQSS